MTTTVADEIKVTRGGGKTGPGKPGGRPEPPSPDSGEWPPGYSRAEEGRPAKYRIGIWVAMASILMLFMALTSAYIWRQTQGGDENTRDWLPLAMPGVLWISTAAILLSSGTLEMARRCLRRNRYEGFRTAITTSTVLGIAFLLLQVMAWKQLAAQGIYISTNPHSSFFYLLTSLHGLHLLGGLVALGFVTVAGLRLRIGLRSRTAVEVTTTYWHFMGGLWVFIFVLLFFFR